MKYDENLNLPKDITPYLKDGTMKICPLISIKEVYPPSEFIPHLYPCIEELCALWDYNHCGLRKG